MELESKKDIRRGERHPLEGAVQVHWQSPSGEQKMIRAKCVDVSENGVRILSEQPIDLRTNVFVQAPAFGLMGNASVRYCRRLGLRHSIGLMFSSALSMADSGRKRCLPDQPGAEKL